MTDDATMHPAPTFWRRVRAWLYALFLDDGYVRAIYNNFHKVDAHLYRSSHPLPLHFTRLARRGVKTIVCLRRDNPKHGAVFLSHLAAKKHNIRLVFFPLSSSRAPSIETITAAKQLFSEIDYPALIHCKSGADRAGLMVTLYNLLARNLPFERANALKWYYGHIRLADTGVLDKVFDTWQADAPDAAFEDWVHRGYNPEAIQAAFRQNRGWNWVARKLLRRE